MHYLATNRWQWKTFEVAIIAGEVSELGIKQKRFMLSPTILSMLGDSLVNLCILIRFCEQLEMKVAWRLVARAAEPGWGVGSSNNINS